MHSEMSSKFSARTSTRTCTLTSVMRPRESGVTWSVRQLKVVLAANLAKLEPCDIILSKSSVTTSIHSGSENNGL